MSIRAFFQPQILFRIAAGLAAAVILLIAGAVVLVQTPFGRDQIAGTVSGILSDETMRVHVVSIDGNLFGAFSVPEVIVETPAGARLAIRDINVQWRPVGLLRGALEVSRVEIGQVLDTGFLDAMMESTAESSNSGAGTLDFGINIDAIQIDDIDLQSAMLGERQRLSLRGSLAVGRAFSEAGIDLSLSRIDGVAGLADVAIDYRARPARFAARAKIDEPDGGLIARLSGLPANTPLSISLEGNGPPDNWTGQLIARAGDLVDATAGLAVVVADTGVSLTVDGEAGVAALIPEVLRPILGPRFTVRSMLAYRNEGLIDISGFHLENGQVDLQGEGGYRLADGTLNGKIGIAVETGQPDAFGVKGLTIGSLRADLVMAGTAARPELTATFGSGALGVQPIALSGITGNLDAKPLGGGAWSAKGIVTLAGLDTAGAVPPGLLGDNVVAQFDSYVLDDGSIPHLGVTITTGGVIGSTESAIAQDGSIDGNYTIRLASSGPVAAALGAAVDGTLAAKGRYRVDSVFANVEADVAGTFQQVADGPAWARTVLGDTVAFGADMYWQDGAGLKIGNLKADSALARITASGDLDPLTGGLSASYSLAVDDLAGLSALAGVPVAGTMRMAGTALGKIEAPTLNAQVDFNDTRVNTVDIGTVNVGVKADIRDAAVLANLRLGGLVQGKKLDGVIAVTAAESGIRADTINVAVGRNSISGKGGLVLDGMKFDGDLVAKLESLGNLPIGGFVPGLAGEMTIRATARGGVEPHIVLAVSGAQVGVFVGTVDEIRSRDVTAEIRIRELFATPAFEASVALAGVRMSAGLVEAAEFKANGTMEMFGWSFASTATLGSPVSLSAAGDVSMTLPDMTMTVQQLDGRVGEHPIALLSPARMQVRSGTLSIGPLAVSLDSGRFDLEGTLTPDSVAVDASLRDLPTAIASLFAPTLEIGGMISGELTATGARDRPAIQLVVTGTDIMPVGAEAAEFSGLNARLEIRQDESDLQVALRVDGLGETQLEADIRTNALIVPNNPWIRDLSGASLSGQFSGKGQLSIVDAILGLGGDRLEGAVTVQATVSGTILKPALLGELRLRGGEYEGVATGVVLKEVDGHIAFSGNEAQIVSLQATDGRGGSLSGSGAVAISGAANTTGELTLLLDRFAVYQRPVADVVASGSVALKGPLATPQVVGTLTVDSAEIRIPDRLPTSVAELEVVEVNRPDGNGADRKDTAEPSLSHAVAIALDLSIGFPGRSFVRGRGLDSEWGGDIHIGGNSVEPLLSGQLNVVRGTFAFAGKTFIVTSGSVTFGDDATLEPEIDVVTEAKLETILAGVRVEGKASKPSITVSSEPALPQEEVLAQILFGRSTGQLSAIQALQLAQSAATLSGAGGTNVVDRIRQSLGVDVLNVESGGDTAQGATLKAGKYISEDVFLSVSQGTEPGSQKVGVQVEVLPNVSVDIDVGGNESGNVGVNWKFDY